MGRMHKLATSIGVLALGVACTAPTPTATEGEQAGRCLAATAAPPSTADVTVTLEASKRYQTIQGFGTTERLFDDPHVTNTFDPVTRRAAVVVPPGEQGRIFDALYKDLGLTRVRYNPRDDQGADAALEPVNDNLDPSVTDLSKFDLSWKKNDGHIEYVKAVRPRGVTTYYASPLTLESWMGEGSADEYVEWAMTILRRWRDQGVEMPYYSVMNEPGNPRNGVTVSGTFLRDVIKRLGAKLRAEGFRTRIVAPDDINPIEALARLRIILADPDARQYVAAIAYHLYGSADGSAVKQLAAQYNIPVWMTEYSQPDWLGWASTMHSMLADYDAAAVDYMWGYFGQWETNNSQLVRITHVGNAYSGFTFTKQYHVMGQYSRAVRPGMVRIGATSSDHAVKVTAYTDGQQVVVVAVNAGAVDRAVRVELGTGVSCLPSLRSTRTSATEDQRPLVDGTVSGSSFAASLAGNSVTTYVLR